MKISIIGAGNMGSAIAKGIIKSGISNAKEIFISNAHEEKLDALKKEIPGIYTSLNNIDVATKSEFIILAVKPWLMETVIKEIKGNIEPGKNVIVSIAAGISIEALSQYLDNKKFSIFRLLPNTAIALQESMTFVTPNSIAKEEEINTIIKIFNGLGKAILIPEKQMGAMTSLSSCGIAYILRFIRAASEGAVELGIKPDIAHEVVAQTMIGAAQLILQNHTNPEVEIDKVTTPGGWTIKGLNAMENNGFTKSVIAAIKANQ